VRTMSDSIEIQASRQAVWEVLTDLAAYPAWNPLFVEASGEIAAGQQVTLRSAQPRGRTMTVRVTILAAEPGLELRWTAGLKGLIGGEHAFRLTAEGDRTRLVQSETFGGLLVPFSGRVLQRAEESFRELNAAIKKRAEDHSARPASSA
jgi:hypothetical protein